ncbi:MAG: flagellar hook protein FlgE [Candidatus Kapabacteria bacterium]|nr:flagellar hook protein FlgE [Candidatus Kapabacteria bacterium]
MGLIRSLTVGASSMIAHQRKFDVISNNLANASTIGYKSNRATFVDQLSQTYRTGSTPSTDTEKGSGGVDPMQFGMGVKIGSVQMNMNQGIIENTDRPLDMALNGDGFFVYKQNGVQKFSRAGAVSKDKEGYLVDANSGSFLQGYNVLPDANGKPSKGSNDEIKLDRKIANLRIAPSTISHAKQTTIVSVNGNLDSGTKESDGLKPTSIQIFDNTGIGRNIEVNFKKTANINEYELSANLDGKSLPISETIITFNADGTLKSPFNVKITAANLNTSVGGGNVFDAVTPQDLTIILGSSNNSTSDSITQFSGASSASLSTQDGYKAGTLQSYEVDTKGKVLGSFSNGRTETLGQVVLARFTNSEALQKQGNNFYIPSPDSGIPNFGTATENFASTTVIGRSLEQSNVDLTEQFTDMISTQRAFEAASRTITVSDQLLTEINSIKR